MAGGSTGGTTPAISQQPRYQTTTTKPFQAPTPGLEHVIFDVPKPGRAKRAGDFVSKSESLAEHFAATVSPSKGSAAAAKAIKDGRAPDYKAVGEKLKAAAPKDKDGFEYMEWKEKCTAHLMELMAALLHLGYI